MHTAVQAVQNPDRAPCYLGIEGYLVTCGLIEERKHIAPQIGGFVWLIEVDTHGLAGEGGELAHPGPLVGDQSLMLGSELKDPMPGAANRPANAHQLVGARMGTGNEFAALALVKWRAAGAETEGAGAQGFFHKVGHRSDVGGIGGFVRSAAVAHNEGP